MEEKPASRTLILGAGFGGIAASVELRRLLPPEHQVVLVDRRPSFAMGLRKLWELVGHATIADGSRSRARLAARGIRFVQADVEAIDPAGRAAVVGGGRIEADRLVVALGGEPRPDLVPGLAEHGHDVWDADRVAAAAEALSRFDGGRIAIVVAGTPYPCPPAPYECALLVDEHLRGRGLRGRTHLSVTTLQPLLLPAAGADGSGWLGGRLDERGIEWAAGRKLERVEAGRLVYADGEAPFDLLVAVPPHRAPAVVAASGLAGEGGWIPVDGGTLATSVPGVYAVGDVTQVQLANGLQLPKAGVIAEQEGTRLARAIAAELTGAPPPPEFDGRGFCFVELGVDEAALVDGDFFAAPEPRVELVQPSAANAAAKRLFESERLEHWFG